MSRLTLVIGDKNLSTWSMRPWLALKASGLSFKEVKILLDRPNTKKLIKKYSKAAKVPVLIDGTTTIWDSLSICEYIAELAPEKTLWPKNKKERAMARSYVAEMHSSFQSMRSQMSMDIALRTNIKHLSGATISDIQRVLELWTEALKKSKGPFLFGEFGIVDAFYAPVVFRFISYGIEIKSPLIKKYMTRIKNHSAVKSWLSGAKKEKPYYNKF